jgi:nucleoside-diphosphate-sugar epimerase
MHGLIGGYLDRIKRGLAPTLYGGKQSNDFTYIADVAQANYLALTAPWDKWNQVYNIGTGEELTAEQAGDLVCKITGWTGGVDKKEQREVDASRFVYDITKAKTMLGFEPQFTFEQGLEDMFKEN